jgi:hypothetical protein
LHRFARIRLLVHDSLLCSQRLCQLNLVLDGRSREGASIWLRTRNGHLTSRLIRPWPGGELAEVAPKNVGRVSAGFSGKRATEKIYAPA